MKYQALNIAEIVDAFRIIPRIILIGYVYMLYSSTVWFMNLPDPSGSQSAFVATLWGAAAAITGFYNMTGRAWTDKS